MPTFKVDMRLHRTITITVEAKDEADVYTVLDGNDDLDPEMYWKGAIVSEDWNQGSPFLVNEIEGKADYVIADTKFGRDFVVRKES